MREPLTQSAEMPVPGTPLGTRPAVQATIASSAYPAGGFAAHSPRASGGAQLPVPPSRLPRTGSGEWPLRDDIEFGSLPGAVPCARLHARHVLWEWGLASLADDVELLVSELMTNAIAATGSTGQISPVRLWLLAEPEWVLVLVRDPSPRLPVPADAGEDFESGRGLMLVEAISQRWDWYLPDTGGKVVWALAGPAEPASG